MPNQPGFIVRILKTSQDGATEFLGTGIIVTPRHVLTCRHVVVETDRYHLSRQDPIAPEYLRIQSADKTRTLHVSATVPDARRDLALLTLASASDLPNAALLHQITRPLMSYLDDHQLEAWGYPGSDGGDSLLLHPVSAKMRSFQAQSDRLSDLQLEGGLPAGCSGGPVLIGLRERFLCIGITRLGGERAPSSRLIAADIAVEFLHEQGVNVDRIDAWKVLSNRERIRTLKTSLVVALLTVLLSLSVLGQKLDDFAVDMLFALRGSLEPPSEIIIVRIDEPSIAILDQPWPWPREFHADLIESLFQAGAKLVVFDLIFAEPSDAESDRRFAGALEKYSRRIVLASQLYREKPGSGAYIIKWIEPHPMFESTGVTTGFSDLVILRGTVRSFKPWMGDRFSLSYQAAKLFVGEFPDQYRSAKLDDLPGEIDINFAGPPGSIRSVNYHEALEAAKYFGEGFFRNKLVFVGVTTNIDEGDAFPIPFTAVGGGMMSGVEIHANAAGNLLYGDYFKRPFKTFIIGVSVLAIIAMAILFFRLRPVKHVILFLGFVVGIFITSLVAFAYQAYLLPVSCLLLPTTGIYLSNLYSYFYGTSGKRNTG